jgi:hypothetical protein
VLVFGEVIDKGGTSYSGDIRGVLKNYADELHKKKKANPSMDQIEQVLSPLKPKCLQFLGSDEL